MAHSRTTYDACLGMREKGSLQPPLGRLRTWRCIITLVVAIAVALVVYTPRTRTAKIAWGHHRLRHLSVKPTHTQQV